MQTIQIPTYNHLHAAAHEFLKRVPQPSLLALEGAMGAGKTTFIKHLCKALGSADIVTSPTFALVNEYQYAEGIIYHFDFYRLQKPEEALEIGLGDYLYSGAWCLMEWPEIVLPYLPENTIRAEIRVMEKEKRILNLRLP